MISNLYSFPKNCKCNANRIFKSACKIHEWQKRQWRMMYIGWWLNVKCWERSLNFRFKIRIKLFKQISNLLTTFWLHFEDVNHFSNRYLFAEVCYR